MAIIVNLQFRASTLNNSLQIGDSVYYTLPADLVLEGGFETTATPSFLGIVNNITIDPLNDTTIISVSDEETPAGGTSPLNGISGVYFSFSKSGKVNQNELIGYWASVKFENNSRIKAELFAVGTEVHENSK